MDPSEANSEANVTFDQFIPTPNDVYEYKYIKKVMEAKERGDSFILISHNFRRVKHTMQLVRFAEYYRKMGTDKEKYQSITQHVWESFHSARTHLFTVHDRDIRRLALT